MRYFKDPIFSNDIVLVVQFLIMMTVCYLNLKKNSLLLTQIYQSTWL